MDTSVKAAIALLPNEAQEYTRSMYSTVEDVYGVNPMDLVNTGNLLQGVSTLLWKQLTGEGPDALATEVASRAERHYYYPYGYSANKGQYPYEDSGSPPEYIEMKNNESISLLEQYNDKYGIVTDEGVEIIKDMIRNNLFSEQFQEARKFIKNIEPGDEFDFKWDLGKGKAQPDILDVVHAIHATDYKR